MAEDVIQIRPQAQTLRTFSPLRPAREANLAADLFKALGVSAQLTSQATDVAADRELEAARQIALDPTLLPDEALELEDEAFWGITKKLWRNRAGQAVADADALELDGLLADPALASDPVALRQQLAAHKDASLAEMENDDQRAGYLEHFGPRANRLLAQARETRGQVLKAQNDEMFGVQLRTRLEGDLEDVMPFVEASFDEELAVFGDTADFATRTVAGIEAFAGSDPENVDEALEVTDRILKDSSAFADPTERDKFRALKERLLSDVARAEESAGDAADLAREERLLSALRRAADAAILGEKPEPGVMEAIRRNSKNPAELRANISWLNTTASNESLFNRAPEREVIWMNDRILGGASLEEVRGWAGRVDAGQYKDLMDTYTKLHGGKSVIGSPEYTRDRKAFSVGLANFAVSAEGETAGFRVLITSPTAEVPSVEDLMRDPKGQRMLDEYDRRVGELGEELGDRRNAPARAEALRKIRQELLRELKVEGNPLPTDPLISRQSQVMDEVNRVQQLLIAPNTNISDPYDPFNGHVGITTE